MTAPAFLTVTGAGGERLIGRAEVAHKLGLTPGRFDRRRKRLAAAGFPSPHPALRGMWREAAVDAWIRNEAPAAAAADRADVPPADQPDPILLARLEHILGARS